MSASEVTVDLDVTRGALTSRHSLWRVSIESCFLIGLALWSKSGLGANLLAECVNLTEIKD